MMKMKNIEQNKIYEDFFDNVTDSEIVNDEIEDINNNDEDLSKYSSTLIIKMVIPGGKNAYKENDFIKNRLYVEKILSLVLDKYTTDYSSFYYATPNANFNNIDGYNNEMRSDYGKINICTNGRDFHNDGFSRLNLIVYINPKVNNYKQLYRFICSFCALNKVRKNTAIRRGSEPKEFAIRNIIISYGQIVRDFDNMVMNTIFNIPSDPYYENVRHSYVTALNIIFGKNQYAKALDVLDVIENNDCDWIETLSEAEYDIITDADQFIKKDISPKVSGIGGVTLFHVMNTKDDLFFDNNNGNLDGENDIINFMLTHHFKIFKKEDNTAYYSSQKQIEYIFDSAILYKGEEYIVVADSILFDESVIREWESYSDSSGHPMNMLINAVGFDEAANISLREWDIEIDESDIY